MRFCFSSFFSPFRPRWNSFCVRFGLRQTVSTSDLAHRKTSSFPISRANFPSQSQRRLLSSSSGASAAGLLPMGDRAEDEDLQMALRMSLHGSPQEPKRSRPVIPEEFEEARERRIQREIRAAAAEKRMNLMRKTPVSVPMVEDGKGKGVVGVGQARKLEADSGVTVTGVAKVERKKEVGCENLGVELSAGLTNQLFTVLFGSDVWMTILARWSNQGIRFSSDPDTSIGLVQLEGGPCGVLAAIQAFVLKYLIYLPEKLNNTAFGSSQRNLDQRKLLSNPQNELGNFINTNEDIKRRALVLSMTEILFTCGGKKRAVVATLNILGDHSDDGSEDIQKDEILSKALEGFTLNTASELQKVLRVTMYTSEATVFERLMKDLPVFQSRMGATLFLISALLSRGLDSIQADRDDPSLPLVTAPFGHASQEIVNLLLCGHAAPNVFDDNMDLGGGMSLKGIPGNVEVGFLTLLESLNFCKVGQYLKCPRWPIWVVGSESHYTVLFALDSTVQDENVLEARQSLIRRTFNNHDQSGGGGFIAIEALHQVLKETDINLPPEKLNEVCNTGYVVWSDFWQALTELDRSSGGMKDSNTKGVGNKEFEIYHFNGIAKSVANGSSSTSPIIQRPRLCKLIVSVPPVWTQDEFMSESSSKDANSGEVNQIRSPQYAPLVDCIRTRWARAVCYWDGNAPSIV